MTEALSILDSIDRTRMSPGDSASAECIRQTEALSFLPGSP